MCSPSRAAREHGHAACQRRGCRRSLLRLPQRHRALPAPGRLCRAAPGVGGGRLALVLQPTALASDAHGGASVAGHASALLALELALWAGAAASLVYRREQLQARNDPWLQMLALQASGYGRDEEEAEQRRRARAIATPPGCPYAGRAPW